MSGIEYRPYSERKPDTQYRDRLKQILETGVLAGKTPQGVGAITCFGELPPMVFEVSNGAPLLTERRIGFWSKPIAEIFAFVNGITKIEHLREFGCDFWDSYAGRGTEFGLEPNDLGPASYGGAFARFPMPNGSTFDQISHVVYQIKYFPHARTHLISPWIPFWIGRGGYQKAVVSPCHGWMQFRVFDQKLSMIMYQRSADFPIGVPSNMIQYFAFLLAMAQVTGLEAWKFIHHFGDAHIYENQVDCVRELLKRESKKLPILKINPHLKNIFAFRADDFELEEYDPHPAMKIPFIP